MVDAGFEKRIDRPSDALRWALGPRDVVSEPGDWVATPVPGQRAVTMSPGQGRSGQIVMPGGFGEKTVNSAADPHVLPLNPASGGLPFEGKLICRELMWTGVGEEQSGVSRFVVLDAGSYSTIPLGGPSPSAVSGLERTPGDVFHMPLYFAIVAQGDTIVRLWDLRSVSTLSKPFQVDDLEPVEFVPTLFGPSTVGYGAESSRSGRVQRRAGWADLQAFFAFGISGINITPGDLKFRLPYAARAMPGGQELNGRMFVPGIGILRAALYIGSSGGTEASVNVQAGPSNPLMDDLDMGSAPGQGTPAISGQYGIPNRSNLLINDGYFI